MYGSKIAELERTIAALRALVIEKDKGLRSAPCRCGSPVLMLLGRDRCTRCDTLALTEDDILKCLEEKT